DAIGQCWSAFEGFQDENTPVDGVVSQPNAKAGGLALLVKGILLGNRRQVGEVPVTALRPRRSHQCIDVTVDRGVCRRVYAGVEQGWEQIPFLQLRERPILPRPQGAGSGGRAWRGSGSGCYAPGRRRRGRSSAPARRQHGGTACGEGQAFAPHLKSSLGQVTLPPSGRSVIRRKNGGKRRGGRQAGSSTGALSGSFPRIPSTVSCQYALAFVRGARHTRHHRSKCEKRPRMLEHVPAWLGKTLRNVRAGHGKLAVARLSGAATLNKDGFALR